MIATGPSIQRDTDYPLTTVAGPLLASAARTTASTARSTAEADLLSDLLWLRSALGGGSPSSAQHARTPDSAAANDDETTGDDMPGAANPAPGNTAATSQDKGRSFSGATRTPSPVPRARPAATAREAAPDTVSTQADLAGHDALHVFMQQFALAALSSGYVSDMANSRPYSKVSA